MALPSAATVPDSWMMPSVVAAAVVVSGAVIGDALSSLPSGVDASALEGWFARWMREGFFVALERC